MEIFIQPIINTVMLIKPWMIIVGIFILMYVRVKDLEFVEQLKKERENETL